MAVREDLNIDVRIMRETRTGVKREDTERFHNFQELYYISEGSCSVFIGRRTYRLKAGDFAVIPAGVLHKTDFLSLGQNAKYVISFSRKTGREIDAFLDEPVAAGCMRAGKVTAPVQRTEAVTLLLNRMLYEYENQPDHARSFCRACLAELLISVLRYRTGQEENDGSLSLKDDRIQQVASYLCEHAAEPLTLESVAARFALSPSHLSRIFKQETGFGIREYLIHYRIQQACELLMTTRLTVTEIADRCGFSDSNYFGDAFRKATGLSPREFRKLG